MGFHEITAARSSVPSRALARAARRHGPDVLRRALRVLGPVREGEAGTVVLLLLNLSVLLFTYYLLKTAREPLILATGGAELKSYAAAVQAAVLVVFVPAYAWLSARMERAKLIVTVVLFFAATIEGFYLASLAGVPHLGFAFYVWLGIFSNAAIALFWSYAGDLHGQEAGERLFPVVAVGAVAGSPVGSWVAERLFSHGLSPFDLMHLGALLLLVHLGLYRLVDRRTTRALRPERAPVLSGAGGFGLVMRSPYLRLVAVLLVLLNVVNTTGEYILGRSVVAAARLAAAVDPSVEIASYIGAYYGRYYFWVNVTSVVLQALLVSRIVKWRGLSGALLALPIISFGTYALVAAGAGLAAITWAKGSENAVDYSAMNTGKQLLWLPTSSEEKYAAKQVIDGFFVRVGDLLAAGVVFAGTHLVGAGVAGFATLNLVLIVLWVLVAVKVLRQHEAMRDGSA
jgi:ATP:ADP antiporter, AAA family